MCTFEHNFHFRGRICHYWCIMFVHSWDIIFVVKMLYVHTWALYSLWRAGTARARSRDSASPRHRSAAGRGLVAQGRRTARRRAGRGVVFGAGKAPPRSPRAGQGPAFNISSLVCDTIALFTMIHTHNLLALCYNANPPILPRHRHFPRTGLAWWSASKRVTIQIWLLCLISLSNLLQWLSLSQAYCLGLQCLPARKFELGNLSIIVSWSG